MKFKGPWTSEELGIHLAEAGISIKPTYCFTDLVEGDVGIILELDLGKRRCHWHWKPLKSLCLLMRNLGERRQDGRNLPT